MIKFFNKCNRFLKENFSSKNGTHFLNKKYYYRKISRSVEEKDRFQDNKEQIEDINVNLINIKDKIIGNQDYQYNNSLLKDLCSVVIAFYFQ